MEFTPLRAANLSQKRLGDENQQDSVEEREVTGSAAQLRVVAATLALLRLWMVESRGAQEQR